MRRMIEFSGMQGYLAVPEIGSGPAVVVVQEWWGLVGHIKNVVDRFAAEGFVALAPDLYDGDSTKEPDEAGSMMMALQMPEVRAKLSEAAAALLDLEETTSEKAGVVGFCMGGQLALFGAASDYRTVESNGSTMIYLIDGAISEALVKATTDGASRGAPSGPVETFSGRKRQDLEIIQARGLPDAHMSVYVAPWPLIRVDVPGRRSARPARRGIPHTGGSTCAKS